MTPKEIIDRWIDLFNNADADQLAELYSDDATNHQIANEPVHGKESIRKMFADEFSRAEMKCIPENIFQDGEWVIMEWKDPKEFRGCGFFHIQNEKIIFQRGYWDKFSLYKLYNLSFTY